MKILIQKRTGGKRRDDVFAADLTNLPGSPTLGFGKTEVEAVADLLRAVLYSASFNGALALKGEELESVEIVRE